MCMQRSMKLRKIPKFLYKVVKNKPDRFSSLFDSISIPTTYIIGKETIRISSGPSSGIYGFTQFMNAMIYKKRLQSYFMGFSSKDKSHSLAILKCKFSGIIDYGIGDEDVRGCLVVDSVTPIKIMVQDKL